MDFQSKGWPILHKARRTESFPRISATVSGARVQNISAFLIRQSMLFTWSDKTAPDTGFARIVCAGRISVLPDFGRFGKGDNQLHFNRITPDSAPADSAASSPTARAPNSSNASASGNSAASSPAVRRNLEPGRIESDADSVSGYGDDGIGRIRNGCQGDFDFVDEDTPSVGESDFDAFQLFSPKLNRFVPAGAEDLDFLPAFGESLASLAEGGRILLSRSAGTRDQGDEVGGQGIMDAQGFLRPALRIEPDDEPGPEDLGSSPLVLGFQTKENESVVVPNAQRYACSLDLDKTALPIVRPAIDLDFRSGPDAFHVHCPAGGYK